MPRLTCLPRLTCALVLALASSGLGGLAACDDDPRALPPPDARGLDGAPVADLAPPDQAPPDAALGDAAGADAAGADAAGADAAGADAAGADAADAARELDQGSDAGALLDRGPDAARPEPGPDAAPRPLGASDYCEAVVDAYCPFYLRCGRLAAPDLAGCRARFLESCNARFEPAYQAAEAADRLRFDPAAVQACAAHLAAVDCGWQVSDLAGPCGALWRGLVPVGGRCGPGIESLGCAPGGTCVLGLDLCGTCQPQASLGGPCAPDGPRCAPEARCLEARCVARAWPGEPCGQAGCVLGAACQAGICVGRAFAQPGEACARDGDCAYASGCVAGRCQAAVLGGEACDAAAPCNEGACVGGRCRPPGLPGDPCGAAEDCSTGACVAGRCALPALICP